MIPQLFKDFWLFISESWSRDPNIDLRNRIEALKKQGYSDEHPMIRTLQRQLGKRITDRMKKEA